MNGFKDWLKTRQTIEVPIVIDLTQFDDKVLEVKSSDKKEMLRLDDNNELLIAAQVNEAIQSALDRIEYNLDILRSLTRMPRNPKTITAIAKRVDLGCKLHELVISQVKLDQTKPVFKKRILVRFG